MTKKKAVKKVGTRPEGRPQDDVQQLAQSLDAWAKKLPPKQQTLLQWLLSRSESRQVRIGKGSCVVKINIDQTNIQKAVMDALSGLRSQPGGLQAGSELSFGDSIWPRSGYVWPRSSYVWPRSGG